MSILHSWMMAGSEVEQSRVNLIKNWKRRIIFCSSSLSFHYTLICCAAERIKDQLLMSFLFSGSSASLLFRIYISKGYTNPIDLFVCLLLLVNFVLYHLLTECCRLSKHWKWFATCFVKHDISMYIQAICSMILFL